MISAALLPAACHGNRDLLAVSVRLPLADAFLIDGVACVAHPLGTRITGTAAAGEGDVASVLLPRATCRLHGAVREATVRGGL
jgi:hypothetical protein